MCYTKFFQFKSRWSEESQHQVDRYLRAKGLFVTWVRDGWTEQKLQQNGRRKEVGEMFMTAQNKSGRQAGGTRTNMQAKTQTCKIQFFKNKNIYINSWKTEWI